MIWPQGRSWKFRQPLPFLPLITIPKYPLNTPHRGPRFTPHSFFSKFGGYGEREITSLWRSLYIKPAPSCADKSNSLLTILLAYVTLSIPFRVISVSFCEIKSFCATLLSETYIATMTRRQKGWHVIYVFDIRTF